MTTTTTTTAKTEATTAADPSLCLRLCPLSGVCGGADAPRRGTRAAVEGWAPWAGVHETTAIQSSEAKMTVTMAKTPRRAGPLWRGRSFARIAPPYGSLCVPVLLQERIAVGIMLRPADPLPAVQERLLNEAAILRRS